IRSAIRTTPKPPSSTASSPPRTVNMASSRLRLVSFTPATRVSITYAKLARNYSCCIYIRLGSAAEPPGSSWPAESMHHTERSRYAGALRRGEARRSGFLFILRGVLYQLVFQHFAAGVHRLGIEEDTAWPLEARQFPVRTAEVFDGLGG